MTRRLCGRSRAAERTLDAPECLQQNHRHHEGIYARGQDHRLFGLRLFDCLPDRGRLPFDCGLERNLPVAARVVDDQVFHYGAGHSGYRGSHLDGLVPDRRHP